MTYKGINHVGLVVTDKEKSTYFLRDILGLPQHERIQSWFFVGNCTIHIIEISEAGIDSSLYHEVQHVALQVDNLRDILPHLLDASLEPFQMDFQGNEKPIKNVDQDLSYGIGTIFVTDPDGNLFEFVQIGHGIFRDEDDPFSHS